MSQENVEIVRRYIKTVNSGDWSGMLERLEPNGEWWDREDDPGAGVHRGHDGVRAFVAELLGDVAELQVEPKQFIDAGEYVVVPVRVHGRGRASGAPFEEHEVHVFKLRVGKIIELREYRNEEEALEAVGRSE